MTARACRICGCTEDRACVTHGSACYWVSEDLCSACPEALDDMDDSILHLTVERRRQMTVEGWTPAHDDSHGDGALAMAASCYARIAASAELAREYPPGKPMALWPWSAWWWKPSPDPARNLIKAGALVIADLDRLERARSKPEAA